MASNIKTHGYEIHRSIANSYELAQLRLEADRVASQAGKACVRHLRAISSIFNTLSTSEKILSLIPQGMRPVRSILFDKTETENWPVLWHQDLTISVTEEHDIPGYGPWSYKDGSPHVQPPISLLENMLTIRLHLDDTPSNNGALRILPKSHQQGKISTEILNEYNKDEAVTCECSAGDALLMSPLILHSSRRSTKPSRRRVIHFEYAYYSDLDSKLQWYEHVYLKDSIHD